MKLLWILLGTLSDVVYWSVTCRMMNMMMVSVFAYLAFIFGSLEGFTVDSSELSSMKLPVSVMVAAGSSVPQRQRKGMSFNKL